MLKKKDPHLELYERLSGMLSPRFGHMIPSVTQTQNAAERYIQMGMHFETLMEAINRHDTLKFKWEDLVLLLKLTEGHDEED